MTQDPDFGLHRDFYTFPPEALGEALPEFAIVREIGRGSMGIVYEATRKEDRQRVALKVLPPSPTLGERTLARFLREGRVMARVQHPHITRFLGQGHGEAGGVRLHWFAMEFVDGVPLQERLQVGPLPLQNACEIAVQIARALQFAHERGVVHRDVKPGNVILRSQPTGGGTPSVAITDFGLARETGTGSMTESGAIVGTPMYMAPELVLGGSAQAGTLGDVYALGASLYAMLTGRPPFEGPTAQSVLKQVVDEEPARPCRLRADLPADAEAVVLKAMAKDPRQRYGSASELADDLERLLRGERTLARLPGPLALLARRAARRPLQAALLAAVLLLSAGALQLFLSQRRQQVQEDLAEARNWLAQAATARDEQDRPRTPAQRRELLLAAVSAATDCLRSDADNVDARLLRARAHHELRQFHEAMLDLDAAERLGGLSSELLQRRIATLQQCGDKASIHRLQQDLTRLLASDPSDRTRT
ncbi:MAG TPA: serine/threonine-protein kinase, partial [Burkholderiaceae bacterium]|nr:serine/threonine-protein kinase [Burkholderiaceae bacterium]